MDNGTPLATLLTGAPWATGLGRGTLSSRTHRHPAHRSSPTHCTDTVLSFPPVVETLAHLDAFPAQGSADAQKTHLRATLSRLPVP